MQQQTRATKMTTVVTRSDLAHICHTHFKNKTCNGMCRYRNHLVCFNCRSRLYRQASENELCLTAVSMFLRITGPQKMRTFMLPNVDPFYSNVNIAHYPCNPVAYYRGVLLVNIVVSAGVSKIAFQSTSSAR